MKKIYESAAEKQKAYRERKAAEVELNGEARIENRFIEQHCEKCKSMWNSYTLLVECPYCKEATGAAVEEEGMELPEEDEKMPRGGDKELWEKAKERSGSARKYAREMSEHVKPSEKKFQKVAWQYSELIRYV